MRKCAPCVLVGLVSLVVGMSIGAGRIEPPPVGPVTVSEPTAEVSSRAPNGGPDNCRPARVVSWSLDGEPCWIDTEAPRTGRVARIRAEVNGRELRIAAMIPATDD